MMRHRILTEANSITVDNDGLGDRVVGANDGAILASLQRM